MSISVNAAGKEGETLAMQTEGRKERRRARIKKVIERERERGSTLLEHTTGGHHD